MTEIDPFNEVFLKITTGNLNLDDTVVEFIFDASIDLGNRYYFLIFTHAKVIIGLVEEKEIKGETIDSLATDSLIDMRIFSPEGEIYLWKEGNMLKWRKIEDSITDNSNLAVNAYDEIHYIWGTVIENRHVLCENSRGIRIKFPVEITEMPVKYRVRNYFHFTEDGLIQFDDARLVEFLAGQKNTSL